MSVVLNEIPCLEGIPCLEEIPYLEGIPYLNKQMSVVLNEIPCLNPSCTWYNLSTTWFKKQIKHMTQWTRETWHNVYYLTGSRSMFFLIIIFSADDRNSIKPNVGPPGLTLIVELTCSAVTAITVDGSWRYQSIASAAPSQGTRRATPEEVKGCH